MDSPKGGMYTEIDARDGKDFNKEEKPIICVICGEIFKDRRELSIHVKCHDNDSNYCVEHDKAEIRSYSLLISNDTKHKFLYIESDGKEHQQTSVKLENNYNENDTGAKVCEILSDDESNQVQIPENSEGNEDYCCEYCGKHFNIKGGLTKHLVVHTDERPYSCELCGKAFKRKFHLKEHMDIHTDDKPYSCKECGKKFKKKWNLKLHLDATHTSNKPYSCKLCGMSFKRKAALKQHANTHANERPYFCEECGRSFRRERRLVEHQLVHTTKRPYTCEVCGKMFKHKYYIKHHMLTHTDTKPFSCQDCGKAFRSKQAVKEHMQVHTCSRIYTCHDCKRMFKNGGRHKCVYSQMEWRPNVLI